MAILVGAHHLFGEEQGVLLAKLKGDAGVRLQVSHGQLVPVGQRVLPPEVDTGGAVPQGVELQVVLLKEFGQVLLVEIVQV